MRDVDRVKMIQAIRDLAQFVEDHPELPCPTSVHAQHSLTENDPSNEGVVRDVAAMLGEDAKLVVDDGRSAYVRYEIATYPEDVDYSVHGFLSKEAAQR